MAILRQCTPQRVLLLRVCRFVFTEAVPDQQQRPLEMASQPLHKGKDIIASDVPGNHREIEAHTFLDGRDGHRSRDGEALMAVPTVMELGLPLGGPGAAHRGLEHEATLIDQDQGTALTPGFF